MTISTKHKDMDYIYIDDDHRFQKQLKHFLNRNSPTMIRILDQYGYNRDANSRVFTNEDVYKFAEQGDIDSVRAALNFGNNSENWIIDDGRGGTALHPAAKFGHLDIVKLLIERGADVNADSLLRCGTMN